jgi:hypothetical protein
MKSPELDSDIDFETKSEKGKRIIDAESNATVATTQIQSVEPEDSVEGEHLFHSQMWVKGTSLHFIVDNGIQKNLILAEVVKWLKLPTRPHPQPYNIRWLNQGHDLYVSQQCHLPYAINPFKDEVLCDVASLEFCDVLLGQPYIWKHHVVYESHPRSVIITLGK